jgi:hypothetical protein
MTGPQQLWEAVRDGDAAKVSTLLSTQGAQSFINYQGANGNTPLHLAALKGHAAITSQILASRCSVDHQSMDGDTAAPPRGLERTCGRHETSHCSSL